jgi:hypothetical protein
VTYSIIVQAKAEVELKIVEKDIKIFAHLKNVMLGGGPLCVAETSTFFYIYVSLSIIY